MQYAVFQEQYTSGTSGPVPTANAFNQAALNTQVVNTIPGCSLSGNSIILPAGIYKIGGWVFTDAHRVQTSLYDFGNSVFLLNGMTGGGPLAGIGNALLAPSVVNGFLTTTSTLTIGLNTYVLAAFGAMSIGSGQPEIYSQLIIEQYTEQLV